MKVAINALSPDSLLKAAKKIRAYPLLRSELLLQGA